MRIGGCVSTKPVDCTIGNRVLSGQLCQGSLKDGY